MFVVVTAMGLFGLGHLIEKIVIVIVLTALIAVIIFAIVKCTEKDTAFKAHLGSESREMSKLMAEEALATSQ